MRDSLRGWNLVRVQYLIVLLCIMMAYFILRGRSPLLHLRPGHRLESIQHTHLLC